LLRFLQETQHQVAGHQRAVGPGGAQTVPCHETFGDGGVQRGGAHGCGRLAYNGLAPSPCRAPKLEALLEGQAPQAVSAAALDTAIAESFVARDGLRATWAYRSLVARNLVLRFLQDAQPASQPALDTAA